ncbi:MAG: (Fe-S)-binding protein [Candidatus Thorarchaeota archaeon]
MSSVWTKARKNTPEIDCGLCGYPTCATFARSLVTKETDIAKCPILALKSFDEKLNELTSLSVDTPTTTKPAPEQPKGGVLMSKPCLDAPELQMAEMRIFNGVKPRTPQKFGVLDPVILCWLLDCVSSRYQDMKCSKDLAYAWGDMEETKVHILRDGKVRMRRAKGKEHALESFRIIERTVLGATICNCCGHDLFSILAGLAPSPENGTHTAMNAGSTLSLNSEQLDWTMSTNSMGAELWARMIDLVEPIHNSLTSQLELMITGDFKTDEQFDANPEICKFISTMLEPEAQDFLTMFLRGLAHAFFLDNAILGLVEIRKLIQEQPDKTAFAIDLLKDTRQDLSSKYNANPLDEISVLLQANAARISRALDLYDKWK